MLAQIIIVFHVLASGLFLANIAFTLIWKVCAEAQGDSTSIAVTLRTAIKLDKIITGPCAAIITISGIALLAIHRLEQLHKAWMQVTLALWILSAACAIGFLVPALKRLERRASGLATGRVIDEEFKSASARWNIASLALIVAPICIMLLAIMQPPLWGR